MAEKNYLIEFFNPVFFTLPRWADAAFALRKPGTGAVSLQNRTRWHDAPHAAEQMAAPMNDS